jgi:hypothetical protein
VVNAAQRNEKRSGSHFAGIEGDIRDRRGRRSRHLAGNPLQKLLERFHRAFAVKRLRFSRGPRVNQRTKRGGFESEVGNCIAQDA